MTPTVRQGRASVLEKGATANLTALSDASMGDDSTRSSADPDTAPALADLDQASTFVGADRARHFATAAAEHWPRVQGYLLRRTGSTADAEDLTARVFEIAWSRNNGFVPSIGWLVVTAKNLLANRHRSQMRLSELQQRLRVEMGGRSTAATNHGAVQDRVWQALDQLAEPQRELLVARYWDGLSTADCAYLTSCGHGAVRMRLHRALTAFRQAYSTITQTD